MDILSGCFFQSNIEINIIMHKNVRECRLLFYDAYEVHSTDTLRVFVQRNE